MAELNQDNPRGRTKKVRSRKLTSRVDLTAMVDLAFLLITFFMLTTSLSKPKSMELTLPADGPSMPVDENRTMTILIGAEDKAKCYMGMLNTKPISDVSLNNSELRQMLAKNRKQALAYSGNPDKGLIVLIKPGKKSTYGNLVDVLDEMAIGGIKTYAITDLTPTEEQLVN